VEDIDSILEYIDNFLWQRNALVCRRDQVKRAGVSGEKPPQVFDNVGLWHRCGCGFLGHALIVAQF
jgi:hypothetical protein